MGRARLTGQSGGAKINGIIKEYLVQAGSTISVGDFVEFINSITNGTETVFNNVDTSVISAAKLTDTSALIAYVNSDNYGVALIITINDTTISLGNKTIFNSASTNAISAKAMSSTSVLVAYSDTVNNGVGTAKILSVSGTTITVGTKTTYNTAGPTYYNRIEKLTDTSVIVVFYDYNNSQYGAAIILSISGTAITVPGTKFIFNSAATNHIATAKLSNTSIFVAYNDVSFNTGFGRVLTISGATITTSDRVMITLNGSNTSPASYFAVCAFSVNSVLIAFSNGTTNKGEAKMITINGTALTVGPTFVFCSATIVWTKIIVLTPVHALLLFRDQSNMYGTAIVITAKDLAILLSQKFIFNSSSTNEIDASLILGDNILALYQDTTGYGTAQVIRASKTVKLASDTLGMNGVAKTKAASGEMAKIFTL